MEPSQFFDVIAAVLVANLATLALIFGMIRIRQRDKFDWQSGGALIFAGSIAMMAGYLST